MPRPLFSPVNSPLGSGSCCLPPTMWCLLSLVSCFSKWFCTRNETHFHRFRPAHRPTSQLRPLSSAHSCPDREDHGRCSTHLLLSRAVRLDRVPAVHD